jgi:AraC-like DNA-binding protein
VRATLIHHDFELGRWTRAVRPPDPLLQGVMYRDLLGFHQERARFCSWLEPPRAAVTLMIDLEGALRADGKRIPDAWIGGLDERYAVVEFGGRYGSIDLELTPLGAYRVLGRPVSEIAASIVPLDDVFGREGLRLAERLRGARSWDARFDVIESFLVARVADSARPSPAAEWAYQRLLATDGRARIEALSRELGCSRRHLTASFTQQVGLPPKTIARLIRFHAVRRRMERDTARWADIAFEAGYSDQSHLNRDFRDLAGTTPSDFVARLIPGGGVVGDDLPFVQDAGAVAA